MLQENLPLQHICIVLKCCISLPPSVSMYPDVWGLQRPLLIFSGTCWSACATAAVCCAQGLGTCGAVWLNARLGRGRGRGRQTELQGSAWAEEAAGTLCTLHTLH